jgi:predicted PurR-regulated permease PerM
LIIATGPGTTLAVEACGDDSQQAMNHALSSQSVQERSASLALVPAIHQRTGNIASRLSTWAVFVIAIVLTVTALRLARGFIVPLVLGVLIAYALDPIVRALGRLGIRRWIAAAALVGTLVISLAGVGYSLGNTVTSAINQLPQATGRLRQELRSISGKGGPIAALGRAADDLDAAVSEAAGVRAATGGATPAFVLRLRQALVLQSMTLLGMTSTAFLLVLFVYFILASGDLFKRKIVALAGPSLAERWETARTINDVNRSIERFLLVGLAMNVLVAVCTWGAFHALGLANAGAWGIMAGLLNMIPFLGSSVAAVIFFLAALLQFDNVSMALLTAGVFVAITSLESMLITPWLLGRTGRMNNVAMFGGLLFWGWLWGPWGMALSFPIMTVIKTVADRVHPLRPIGEMLGR